MRRFKVYREWFLEHVMNEGRRNTLVILPIEELETRYRDEPQPSPGKPPRGLSVLFLSPTLGAPEIVVPSEYAEQRSLRIS